MNFDEVKYCLLQAFLYCPFFKQTTNYIIKAYMNPTIETILLYTITAGFLSIIYGYFTGKNILSLSPGNEKMQKINFQKLKNKQQKFENDEKFKISKIIGEHVGKISKFQNVKLFS